MSRVKNTEEKKGKNLAVIALVLLLLAILDGAVYLGWCLPGLARAQMYLLGKGSLLLPLGLLLFSVNIVINKKILVFNRNTIGSVLLFITVLALYHQLGVPVGEELVPSRLPEGGGLLGGLLALAMHKLLSPAACWGLIAFMTLVVLLLLLPLKDMHALVKLLVFSKKPEEKEAAPEEQRKKLAITRKEEKTTVAPSVWSTKLEEERAKEEVRTPQNDRVNVYEEEEFGAFTQGIRKEQPIKGFFKRIIKTDEPENIYEQEELKAEIEKDPVQLPEWEEKGPNIYLRPTIHYGEEKVETPQADNKIEEEPLKEPDQIIDNQYRELLNNQLKEKIEKTTVEMAEEAARRGIGLWDPEDPNLVKGSEQAKNEKKPGLEKPAEIVEPVEIVETVADEPEIIPAVAKVESAGEAKVAAEEPEQETGTPEEEPEQDPPVYSEVYVRSELPEEPQEKEAPKPKKTAYMLPPIDLLNRPKNVDPAAYAKDIREQCEVLERTLAEFKVKAKVVNATRGPSVTRYEVQPAPGVKVNTIVNLAEDIALRMAAPGVRMEAPIPGKAAIGIEVPNIKTDSVAFREIVESEAVTKEKSPLSIGLGKNISGDIITMDIAKMPHMLVAGSTGSGKSVCINTIIAGVLFKARPDEVKMILVDPKVVELTNYNGIPHLLTPVVTDAKKAASALHWAVAEMERRYQLFADNNVRKIDDFNAQAKEPIPYIVIIIDELSDLMMVARVDVEDAILRLAQKARACGIHLIIATQRPSVDVITGIVKANIPSRIAFAVSSNTDSRTILDTNGAEKLLGKGDMLFSPIGQAKPSRVQGAFVSDEELHKIVQFIVNQSIPVNYTEEVTQQELQCDAKNHDKGAEDKPDAASEDDQRDELFEEAVRQVLDSGTASASSLQRRFRIGFTRAGRLIDMMEDLGIIGEAQGAKSREVIMSRQEVEERFFNHD